MRKHILLPALAILGGGVGFGLRKWQLAAGFEADTGLAIAGAPSALALMGWSLLVAGALIFLLTSYQEVPDLPQAFDARENPLFLTANVMAAFLFLASAVADGLNYVQLRQAAGSSASILPAALPVLRIVLCALGLPCALVWARALSHGGEEARRSMALLGLCLLFSIWLLSDYQMRAADPVTADYAYEVLAIACSLMGLYYVAGFSFQAGKPRRTLFMCLMGVFFSLVTLADGHSLADVCRYAAAILLLSSHGILLLRAGEEPVALTKDESEESDHA